MNSATLLRWTLDFSVTDGFLNLSPKRLLSSPLLSDLPENISAVSWASFLKLFCFTFRSLFSFTSHLTYLFSSVSLHRASPSMGRTLQGSALSHRVAHNSLFSQFIILSTYVLTNSLFKWHPQLYLQPKDVVEVNSMHIVSFFLNIKYSIILG